MIYLLDTNAFSFLLRDRGGELFERYLRYEEEGTVALSSIVYGEILYRIRKKGSMKLEKKVQALLDLMEVLPYDRKAAECYGEIRTALSRQGTPIGANDLLIGAHALSLNAVLITNNIREFRRIEGLKLEDWTQEGSISPSTHP